MNEKQLKKIILEELRKVLKEEQYINSEQLTPEQKKIRDANGRKLMSDPAFQQLLEKYGLFANLNTLYNFGLVINN